MSLKEHSVDPYVLFVNQGKSAVIQPSAQSLQRAQRVKQIGRASRVDVLKSIARLMRRSPLRTARALAIGAKPGRRWYCLQAAPAALWCLDRHIVFLHAHFADTNLLFASALSAWTGIPYGVTTHRYDLLDDPLDVRTACELFRGAAAVVTISEFNRALLVEKFGLQGDSIHVVHCGINVSAFPFHDNGGRGPGVAIRVLNVGRLVQMKAQEVLLEAVSIVRKRDVPIMLEVIGDGPRRAELQALANTLGISDSVRLLGAGTSALVADRLAAADLFVLSSRSEGLPVACIEAMAVGTPVIATRVAGVPELIEHGVTGWLVEPNDPQGLADAIMRVARDQALLAAVRLAGRRVVEMHFNRSVCTAQLVALWNQSAEGMRREK